MYEIIEPFISPRCFTPTILACLPQQFKRKKYARPFFILGDRRDLNPN